MSAGDAIDAALTALLVADTALAALMPDGVFYDVARGPATRFVILARLAYTPTYMFQGIAFERFLYLVKAVERQTTATNAGNAKAAGARIDALLDQQPLAVEGHQLTRLVEPLRESEVDDVNADIRWQHRGGHYEILVS